MTSNSCCEYSWLQYFTRRKGPNPFFAWRESTGNVSVGQSIMNAQHTAPPPLMEYADAQPAPGSSSSKKRKKESSSSRSLQADMESQNISGYLSRFGGVDEMMWHLMQNSSFKMDLDHYSRKYGLISDGVEDMMTCRSLSQDSWSDSFAGSPRSPSPSMKRSNSLDSTMSSSSFDASSPFFEPPDESKLRNGFQRFGGDRSGQVPESARMPQELVEFLELHPGIFQTAEDATRHCGSLLGKRGRLYSHIWAENEYLRQRQLQSTYKVYSSWGDLIHNYCDDFDGAYVDKLMTHADLLKRKANLAILNTGIADYNHSGSYWNRQESKRRQRSSADEEISRNDIGEEVQKVMDPPVPVSCWHPAAWYLTERSCHFFDRSKGTSDCHKTSRFECVHPASLRSIPFQIPPAAPSAMPNGIVNSVAAGSNNAPDVRAIQRQIWHNYTTHTKRLGDLDELDIELENLMQQHAMLELSNVASIHRVADGVANGRQLDILRRRRLQYETDILALWSKVNLLSPERILYKMRPSLGNGLGRMADTEASSPVVTTEAGVSPRYDLKFTPIVASINYSHDCRYQTRCSTTAIAQAEQRRKELSKRHDMLGAVMRKHIPHGAFIKQLKIGDLCEFRMSAASSSSSSSNSSIASEWILGTVVGFMTEAVDKHVRFVKVKSPGCYLHACGRVYLISVHLQVTPILSYLGDVHWIAVEDGLLAPMGTHIHGSSLQLVQPQQLKAITQQQMEKYYTPNGRYSHGVVPRVYEAPSDAAKKAPSAAIKMETELGASGGAIAGTVPSPREASTDEAIHGQNGVLAVLVAGEVSEIKRTADASSADEHAISHSIPNGALKYENGFANYDTLAMLATEIVKSKPTVDCNGNAAAANVNGSATACKPRDPRKRPPELEYMVNGKCAAGEADVVQSLVEAADEQLVLRKQDSSSPDTAVGRASTNLNGSAICNGVVNNSPITSTSAMSPYFTDSNGNLILAGSPVGVGLAKVAIRSTGEGVKIWNRKTQTQPVT
jgi:hypothetical protein